MKIKGFTRWGQGFIFTCFFILFTTVATQSYAETYLDVLSEYTQVASAVNLILESRLDAKLASEYNNIKAMSALRDFLRYEYPI
ncbi:MAG: hypothetical protein FDZ69_02095, partial [Deltaproteobacteria bacterium]